MSTAPRKSVEVVAALIFRDNKVLACQRRANGSFALKWEFPGGKVEAGESHLAALRRELKEELEIEIHEARLFFRHRHVYSDYANVDLRFFRVDDYRGEVRNRAFQQVSWVEPADLGALDFLEGDRPLIRRLAGSERARRIP